jgi:adenylate cyclase
LDIAMGSLRAAEREIRLRAKSFGVLHYLVENANRLITKEELVNSLWPNVVASDESLARCISEIRQAIGDLHQVIIKTVPRRGYRFAAPVSTPMKNDTAHLGSEASMAAGPATETNGVLSPELPAPSRPSVAVLAFLNLTGDPQQEYWSDGITEDIITDLSRFSELSVIARNSSFQYKGKAVDVRQIGRELGGRYVLEGSVRRGGDCLRITAQLIDAATGLHRWAERYDRDMCTAFVAHDGVTRAIVTMVAAHVKKAEAERGLLNFSLSRNSYDYFLGGSESYRAHVLDPASTPIDEARQLLQRSLTADSEHAYDPTRARAYAMLARTWVRTYWDPVDQDYLNPAGIDRAYELARKAVLFDASLPIGHFQLGLALLFRRRQDEALAEFERAFALNPNDTDWQFGFGLALAGQSAKAIEVLRTNIELDPFGWPIPYLYMGQASYMLERYVEALLPLRQCAARITGPGLCIVSAFLAATHAQLGHPAEARNAMAATLAVHPACTIEKLTRALPYNNQRDVEHFADGLRKAGLPIA